jgi:hypothetical protein
VIRQTFSGLCLLARSHPYSYFHPFLQSVIHPSQVIPAVNLL